MTKIPENQGISLTSGSPSVNLLFNYSLTKQEKMFYWLDVMQFDSDNRRFNKLNLNETQSKTFIKCISLLSLIFNGIIYSLTIFFIVVICFITFKFHEYKANYLVSILIYYIQNYYALNCTFGFLIILYQVSLT